MGWENWVLVLAIIGIIAILLWPTSTVTIPKNKSVSIDYSYSFIVDPVYGTKMCPFKYPGYNGAILVDKNGTPLNLSLEGKFIEINGIPSTMKIKTCTCDSFIAKTYNCTPGEPVYEEKKVIIVNSYKVISNKSLFYCNTNSDCVPATCCHPKVCVNKNYAPNCKGAICTMMMTPGTLDYGHCACVNNTCEAIINWSSPLR